MSSLTNINNSSSVVNIGRTTPVSPGVQPSSGSIPVVVASDQSAIPVVEQNKVLSEVSLSLLGIPRAEVALGIFADVNTYDVNPTEWSSLPIAHSVGFGIKHLEKEAGALVEAPRNKNAILTSKRFFRYQPGRVSAATFGVKETVSESHFSSNPVVRKYGIFDNFDGYYWETRQSGEDDNFGVVRRTQSLFKSPTGPFGNKGSFLRVSDSNNQVDTILTTQTDEYRYIGHPPETISTSTPLFVKQRNTLKNNRYAVIEKATANTDYVALATLLSSNANLVEEKCKRDLDYWVDMYLLDLETCINCDAHTAINTRNYQSAVLANTFFEIAQHTEMQSSILSLFSNTDPVYTRLNTLTQIPIDFFSNSAPQENPVIPTDYGSKSELETVFDVRHHYWSYLASEFAPANTSNISTYTSNTSQLVSVTYSEYTSSMTGRVFSPDEVKYKCQRDIDYIIDGYKDDIVGGGNARTKFNASMYYKGNGLSVGSQGGANTVEKNRHKFVQFLINEEFSSNTFSYTSEQQNKFDTLSNLIIDNFEVEDVSVTEYGNRAVPGNLVALRDGLVVVHAGVYDTNLLRAPKKIPAITNPTKNSVKIVDEVVTYGQHVKYFGANNGGLIDGKLYKVFSILNPKGNEFTLSDPLANTDIDSSNSIINIATDTANASTGFIQTVNPFIFPAGEAGLTKRLGYSQDFYLDDVNTQKGLIGAQALTENNDPFPKGMMFPYKYSDASGGILQPESGKGLVGFINTTHDLSTETGVNDMRTDIDNVNFLPEYINWIQNNVDPEYYSVYEYRVPRSRFSTDKLNGRTDNPVVYSDIATLSGGKKLPGDPVIGDDGSQVLSNSVYDLDFKKVTMLKIEFSWYGAVGALFLAYVPVGNGEARWVRVHHLRASNQLKIPSLGNATLPITYNVYGGGDSNSLGDGEENVMGSVPDYGYGNPSHHIVKYGASYYIDGGDRGTVRLFSHNNESSIQAYGKKVQIGSPTVNTTFDSIGLPFIEANTTVTGVSDNTFFVKSSLRTNEAVDQSITVEWVDGDKLYLSDFPVGNTNFSLLPDRSNYTYGIETKQNITSKQGQRVRNRVQVYPTKLSTAHLGSENDNIPVRLRLRKTPTFQTLVSSNGTFILDTDYLITNNNLPLMSNSTNFIENDEDTYGWFRATVDNIKTTVFGRLYKEADNYYFDLRDSINGLITLNAGNFLEDPRFDARGNILTNVTKTNEEIEGLSSVLISKDVQVPIPGTGISLATIYIKEGSEQVELNTFFDYNKEYLSFPLTDIPDSLYFIVDKDSDFNLSANTTTPINIAITWEEQ